MSITCQKCGSETRLVSPQYDFDLDEMHREFHRRDEARRAEQKTLSEVSSESLDRVSLPRVEG